MHTVAELIEALEQCPQNYQVRIHTDGNEENIESVAIDHETKSVILYPY